jgi:hypothetical protein
MPEDPQVEPTGLPEEEAPLQEPPLGVEDGAEREDGEGGGEAERMPGIPGRGEPPNAG